MSPPGYHAAPPIPTIALVGGGAAVQEAICAHFHLKGNAATADDAVGAPSPSSGVPLPLHVVRAAATAELDLGAAKKRGAAAHGGGNAYDGYRIQG